MSYLQKITRENLIKLKREGSFINGIELRIKEYLFVIGLMFSSLFPYATSMALLGAYLVKKGTIKNLRESIDKIKIPFLSITFLFITYRFIFLYGIKPNFELEKGSIVRMILINLFILADMALALLYVWFIVYAYRFSLAKKLLFNFSFAGKMAFTNYILQSIIGYILMRSGGLYETLTPITAIIIVLIVFIGQVIISRLWLSIFKLGPLEWFWRCISYGKIIPIKIKAYNIV
tara:strand:- start:33 stop:731 length:699 start_codon:yes stop_codon:yes gene_type:complete